MVAHLDGVLRAGSELSEEGGARARAPRGYLSAESTALVLA